MTQHSDYLTSATLDTIKRIALDAGAAIMEVYKKDVSVMEKSDQSPLTEADLAAHNLILKGLVNAFPDIPVLSEESTDITYQDRKDWPTFWLVDPLDGTKEFIKKNDEFTVNIALIHQGQPVLGVVYAPALDLCYLGAQGLGAFKQAGQTESAIHVDDSTPDTWIMVGSRSHPSEHLAGYLAAFEDYQMIPKGSSLKLCMIAEGSAHLYPRLGPTCEWDTAAAHAVVLAAGGVVNDKTGQPLMYNKADILNPWFFVHSKAVSIPLIET
jgi:3'(2'), 5'-bisphosphate nucleotidase